MKFVRSHLALFALLGVICYGMIHAPIVRPPVAPSTPVAPSPAPAWTLYIFTMANCPWCDRLETSLADPRVQPLVKSLTVVRLDISSPEANQYRVYAAPALVLTGRHTLPEVKKGYQTADQLAEWLGRNPTPTRKRPFRPRGEDATVGPGKPVIGGRTSPDGKVTLVCDLPATERKKNIPSKGLGCCVFRSGDYAARWQNVAEFYNLPEQMVKAGIPGGGYPEKVDKVFAQFGPNVQYVQDTTGDATVLEAILKSGRMPCVTYCGHDPHYGNQSIAHMVCLPCFDRTTGWAAVSDNNFTGENDFIWMACDEFVKRWKGGGGGGWVFCLLNPPPPPIPH